MYDSMQANILPLAGEVKRSKHIFLLKVVVLHFKLTGRMVMDPLHGHLHHGWVGGGFL